jgi:hypothetical protein
MHGLNRLKMQTFLTLFSILLLVALPPKIGMLPTPAALIQLISPAFRRGNLLIAPLLVVAALICSLTIAEVTRDKGKRLSYIIACFFCLFIAFDGWSKTPGSIAWFTKAPSNSQVLSKLADLPPGLVFHYSTDSDDATACLLQNFHQQPIVNSCSKHPSSLLLSLQPYDSCASIENLKKTEVKYLIVDNFNFQLSIRTRIDQVLACIERSEGIVLLDKDDQRSLWKIT